MARGCCGSGFLATPPFRRIGRERIVIELTENSPFFDFSSVRAALTDYRNLGFNVAIDDLGLVDEFHSRRRRAKSE